MASEPKWIVWNGGACPVDPGAKVRVMLRNGQKQMGRAREFSWGHAEAKRSAGSRLDIKFYQVVRAHG